VLTILADENIALVHEAFAALGTLRTATGRDITPALLDDVDILLVRSITRVDATLLSGSRCRFVGTATSGTDHVDQAWLKEQGIAFTDAHGSNAEGVVDYVLAALALLAGRNDSDWQARSCGIIGCGAVGHRLAERVLALGMKVHVYDPFLDMSHPLAACFSSLDVVLQQDIVSLHTPLTYSGPWPTFHMLDAERLALLQPDAILINAARGAVLDTPALLERMAQAPLLRVVLDAWEGEPAVDRELLARVAIGTPHIAGYSRLGKLRGTLQLRAALYRHLALAAPGPLYTEEVFTMDLQQTHSETAAALLRRCILGAYDLTRDHADMQAMLNVSAGQAALDFDRLRKCYPERAEFRQFTVSCAGLHDSAIQALKAAGFNLA